MDLNLLQPKIDHNEPEDIQIKLIKRKIEVETTTEKCKKLKTNELVQKSTEQVEEATANGKQNKTSTKSQETGAVNENLCTKVHTTAAKEQQNDGETKTKVPSSPKKRLEVSKPSCSQKENKEKFIYGNYSQYYGYRNKDKDNHDIRLDVFAEQKEIFKNKQILDIGCNSGFITMEVAKQLEIKSIVGLDIDKSLINQAIKNLTKCKKSLPMDNELKKLKKFPFNVTFVHGNYVLKDDVLLGIEKAQFDVILCLSITKWIHLNFGDKGLKQAFRRMFLQLKPQGRLILEAQPFDNYGRRKKMTVHINKKKT